MVILPCPFRSTTPASSNPLVDMDNTPYNPLYMRLACHGTPSQCPPLHPLPCSSCLNIAKALRLTWTRCIMDMLGTQPKPPISKMILDTHSCILLVSVISHAQMIIVITYIAMGEFATPTNDWDELLSHFVWEIWRGIIQNGK